MRLVKIIVAFHREPVQSIEALSKLTGYSRRTVRRDLYAFEQEGVCDRLRKDHKLFWKLSDTLGQTTESAS
jgi:DeoR/GlpR family transcriptional regulator of sugar metabolism